MHLIGLAHMGDRVGFFLMLGVLVGAGERKHESLECVLGVCVCLVGCLCACVYVVRVYMHPRSVPMHTDECRVSPFWLNCGEI